tara:strand:+ start:11716 stop:12996 length:1281 start_codon:yes stop_codon:yes gene_type:complete
MKLNNLLNGSLLRQEADDTPAEGSGLLAGLADLDTPKEDDASDSGEDFAPTDSGQTDGLPPVDDDGRPVIDIPSASEPDDEPSAEEEDLGLPALSALEEDPPPVDNPTAFDESAFDAETAALLKGLEDKGHPGDVYKDLRAKLKDYESGAVGNADKDSEIAQLSEKVASLEETAAEVEAMKERVVSIASRNSVLLLEESPEYQDKVVTPHEEIKKTVAALAEVREMDPKEIWDVISENDPVKRTAALDSLESRIGGRNAMEVAAMAKDIRVISHIDKTMRENADEIVKAARDRELSESSKEAGVRSEAFKGAAKENFEKLASKIPGFTDGNGQLSAAAKKSLAKSSLVRVNDLTTSDLGYMAFAVESLPQALKHIQSMEKQIQDLKVAAGDKGRDILAGKSAPAAEPEESRPGGTFLAGFNERFGK